jgi:hypothetical protein
MLEIDLTVKAIEKLIQLLQYRERRQEKIFAELVAPMYKAVEAIHTEHLSLKTSQQSAISTGESIDQVLERLSSMRLIIDSRLKRISAQASTFEGKFPKYASFFKAVAEYFSILPHTHDPERLKRTKEFGVDATARFYESISLGINIREVMDSALTEKWNEIVQTYVAAEAGQY